MGVSGTIRTDVAHDRCLPGLWEGQPRSATWLPVLGSFIHSLVVWYFLSAQPNILTAPEGAVL